MCEGICFKLKFTGLEEGWLHGNGRDFTYICRKRVRTSVSYSKYCGFKNE